MDVERQIPVARAIIEREEPLITGVQIHLGELIERGGYQPDRTIAVLGRLGAVAIRDSLSAARMGTDRKKMAGSVPGLSRLLAARQGRGAALLTLNAMPRGSDRGLPMVDEARASFAAFAADAASLQPDGNIYEVWNEWDRGDHGKSDGAVEEYVQFVREVAPAVRRASPEGTVLAGAAADSTGNLKFEWTKSMIRAGVLKYADAVSVHAYNHCSKSRLSHAANDLITRLDELHSFLIKEVPEKADIYVSEFGWPTGHGSCSVDEAAAADHVAQFLVLASTRPWIRGVWYYELKDSAVEPLGVEGRFGLLNYQFKPKPAFCAFSDVSKLLRSSTPLAITKAGGMVKVEFTSAEGDFVIMWTVYRGATITYPVTGGSEIRPVCGYWRRTELPKVEVTSRPLIVRLNEKRR